MTLIGALVALAGYTMVWAGAQTLHGCKPSIQELLVPGRFAGCHDATGAGKDSGAPTAGDLGGSGFGSSGSSGSGAGGGTGGGGSW